MSDGEHTFPIELVEKEINGAASAEEISVLETNKPLWREHLKNIKRKVEQTLSERKAHSLSVGYGNPEAIKEFHSWKVRATRFKMETEKRLSRLKNSNGMAPMSPILEDILAELRFIADLLEDRESKK
jgi:hypothetical protein